MARFGDGDKVLFTFDYSARELVLPVIMYRDSSNQIVPIETRGKRPGWGPENPNCETAAAALLKFRFGKIFGRNLQPPLTRRLESIKPSSADMLKMSQTNNTKYVLAIDATLVLGNLSGEAAVPEPLRAGLGMGRLERGNPMRR